MRIRIPLKIESQIEWASHKGVELSEHEGPNQLLVRSPRWKIPNYVLQNNGYLQLGNLKTSRLQTAVCLVCRFLMQCHPSSKSRFQKSRKNDREEDTGFSFSTIAHSSMNRIFHLVYFINEKTELEKWNDLQLTNAKSGFARPLDPSNCRLCKLHRTNFSFKKEANNKSDVTILKYLIFFQSCPSLRAFHRQLQCHIYTRTVSVIPREN